MEPADGELMTIGDVAKALGVPRHRVSHAIEVYGVEAHQRAGIIRLWRREDLPAIASAVRRCAGRRSGGAL